MRLFIAAIRDLKVEGYSAQPMFVQSEGAARRMFTDEINRKADDNLLSKHPEDFELMGLGYYDSERASFELFETPKFLCSGVMVLIS